MESQQNYATGQPQQQQNYATGGYHMGGDTQAQW